MLSSPPGILRRMTQTKHQGSCHCGTVRFAVELDASAGTRCNCRICTKIGGTTRIVKPEAFTLLSDESTLGAYGNDFGRRYFCPTCAVHCFARGHLEQLGGDYVSVSLNCLDDIDLGQVELTYWDGRHDNWQAGTRTSPWPVFTDG